MPKGRKSAQSMNRPRPYAGRVLREAREAAGVTLLAVAAAVRIPPGVFQAMESGAVPVGVELFVKLAGVYGREPGELLEKVVEYMRAGSGEYERASQVT